MSSPDAQTVLQVSEVFCAPQGEGGRSGQISLFIRLQGCSAKHACAAAGVVCDTEFESGRPLTLDQIAGELRVAVEGGAMPPWIIWTGGEPLDQLTPEIVQWFKDRHYKQAIETSGVRPFPKSFRLLFDWITCSPKVAEHILVKHFGEPGVSGVMVKGQTGELDCHVHELRYVRHIGQSLPKPSLKAMTHYVSPHSDGFTINQANVNHCIKLCKQDPKWRISLQQHKLMRSL